MNKGYNNARLEDRRYFALREVADAADHLHLALFESGAVRDKRYAGIDYALAMATASRNLEETRRILFPVWSEIEKKLYIGGNRLFSRKRLGRPYTTLKDFIEQ